MTTEEPGAGTHPLTKWGFSDRVAALEASARDQAPADAVLGRVVRVTRTRALVQTTAGEMWVRNVDPRRRAPVGPEVAPRDDEPPPTRVDVVTGDWLLVVPDELPEHDVRPEQTAEAVALLPRWSQLARSDAMGRHHQLLGADIDTVFVVAGLDRPVPAGRIERSLALAYEGGAEPVVVLTKADTADPEPVVDEVGEVARGVAVVTTARGAQGEVAGLDELRRWVRPGRTVVLLGPSGAGKSTLVNALLGTDVQEVGRVREADAKGRHTTTSRDLFAVPGGGVLLDTPGTRSLGLWDAADGVAQVFDDLEELAADCRFRDCAHRGEPGCAVQAAVEAGDVDPDRVARWLAYLDELAAQEQSREEAERERRRTGRTMSKEIRRYYDDGASGGRQKGRRR